ncbi:MAG: T9SS type A sorting domain-containing protein, partial [Cryomorphaceae bacterium]
TDPTAFNFNPEATIDDGTCVPFAANDEACGAILLACNEEPLTGNFNRSTAGEELDECVSPFIPSFTDIWFKFESDGNSDYTIFDNAGLNPAVGLYTGDDCENLTEVAICPEGNSSFSGNYPAGTYYFLVRPTGNGPIGNFYSVGLTCTPFCTNPFPPVNASGITTTFQGNGYQLSWGAVPNQIGCQIAVRFAGGNTLGQQIVGGANAQSLFVPGSFLQLGTDYEWRVRCGCSQSPIVAGPWSAWQGFTTPGGASITSSPNPSDGHSFVSFTATKESYATLEVFDLSGRLVESIFAGNIQPDAEYRFEFDGSDLPNGVYLYRLTTATESIHEKFMLAR